MWLGLFLELVVRNELLAQIRKTILLRQRMASRALQEGARALPWTRGKKLWDIRSATGGQQEATRRSSSATAVKLVSEERVFISSPAAWAAVGGKAPVPEGRYRVRPEASDPK